jgi:AcrR family transcriptional regulator
MERSKEMADEKRAALLQPILDHLMERGLHDAGLRALAARAGTSDRMLIYHFGNKEALLTAALDLLAQQLGEAMEPALDLTRRAPDEVEALLRAKLAQDHFAPALTLLFEVITQATRGVAPYPAASAALQRCFTSWIDARLDAPPLTRPAATRRILSRVLGELLVRTAPLT